MTTDPLPDPFGTPEGALAAIEDDIAGAEERARLAHDWASQMMSLSAEGRAVRGQVRVRVNIDGLITGLSISDEVASHGGRQVRTAVLTALKDAMSRLRATSEDLTARQFPGMDATQSAVNAELSVTLRSPDLDPDDQYGPRQNPGGTW